MNGSSAKERIDPQVLKVAMVLIAGGMAVIFDTTIVSVALHTLAAELHATVGVIQWVSTGYLLALGVTVPLVGWAQARFGGKKVWMAALVVFLVGSIASSLAWSAASLIAFRIVQGIGGGLMMPLMATLVMQAARGKALGSTMAIVTLPAILGPVLGPVLGGAILQWLNWHWLFWVNVPFCILGFVLAWRLLPADDPVPGQRLDVVGLLLLSPGVVGVFYGLSNASNAGGFGRADVLAPTVLGVALLIAFVVYAARQEHDALVNVRLLARRSLASSSALLFLSGAVLFGAMLLLPLYFQEVRGATPLTAGLLLAPQGVGTLLSRSLAGRLSDSVGVKWVSFAGFAIVGLATVPFGFVGPDTNVWLLMAALLVRGFGLGAVTIPLMAGAFLGLDRSEIPHASIITRICQQIGGSFGVALFAVILDSALAQSGGRPSAAAFDQAFWWASAFTLAPILLSLTLPGRPKSVTTENSAAATVSSDPS